MTVLNRDRWLQWYEINVTRLTELTGIEPSGDEFKPHELQIASKRLQTHFDRIVKYNDRWCCSVPPDQSVTDQMSKHSGLVKYNIMGLPWGEHPIWEFLPESVREETEYRIGVFSSGLVSVSSKDFKKYTPSAGEILIDENQIYSLRLSLGREQYATTHQFLADFIEFCDFSEKVCLYDKLIVPLEAESMRSAGGFHDILLSQDILRFDCSYVDARRRSDKFTVPHFFTRYIGRLNRITTLENAMSLLDRPQFRRFRKTLVKDVSTASETAEDLISKVVSHNWMSVLRPLAIDYLGGVSYIPSIRTSSDYFNLIDVQRSEALFTTLWQVYQQVASEKRSQAECRLSLSGLRHIYIPPLASVVLDKIDRPDQLIPQLLEIRESLAPLRRMYSDYRAMAADQGVSNNEWAKSLNKLESNAKAFLKSYGCSEAHSRRQIAIDSMEIFDPDKLYNGFGISDISVKGLGKLLLGWPLERILRAIRTRRFRPLSKLLNEYGQIKPHRQDVKRVFEVLLDEDDFQYAKTYTKRIPLRFLADNKEYEFHAQDWFR